MHIKLPTDRETPVQSIRHGPFGLRYAYLRSRDCQENDEPGQDYLTVAIGERHLSFALCDGVSQSFFGELAAKGLGDGLLEWLERDSLVRFSRDELAGNLLGSLGEIQKQVSEQVSNQPLGPEIPPIVQEVLEEKRRLGSESMFVCGRLELTEQGHLFLAWMGDSRLRLVSPDGREMQFEADFDTRKRWSSERGLIGGVPAIVSLSGEKIREYSLLAYSDGFEMFDTLTPPQKDQELQNLLEETRLGPSSDDVSYLEVSSLLTGE